jgi:glycosyltransferase involved in cell wall biosynthesis
METWGQAQMADELRVAHVVLSLDCGGLERVVVDLVREGLSLGQRQAVICLERPGTLAASVEALGAPLFCLDKRPGLRPGLIRSLRTTLLAWQPDAIHTHQIGALFYAGPAAKLTGGPPLVHTEHGKHYAARPRNRWLGRLAGRWADRFFCVSADIAREVEECRVVPRRKIEVVPNGIDTDRFRLAPTAAVRSEFGIPAGAPIVGTVGRLSEIKCQDLLIRAFARLRTSLPGAHLLLVGDGPLREDLQRLAAELGLRGAVHFAGYQARPERYLRAMDIFALTSRSEGLPLAVLEAWAAGVPVVASAVGGLPELIDHGRNGLLFRSGDEAALTAALGAVLSEPGCGRRVARAGQELARERYDVRVMASRYEGHYRELLGHRKVKTACTA